MISLNKTEADIVNYLYKTTEAPYAFEISKKMKMAHRTVYDALESLEEKGVVEKETKGRMKFYRLSERWREIAEAAKHKAETDEASLHPKDLSINDKIDITNQILDQLLAQGALSAPSISQVKKELNKLKKKNENVSN